MQVNCHYIMIIFNLYYIINYVIISVNFVCFLVILLRISSVRKVKNSEVSYTVKVTAVCSSGQGVSIRLDATKTSLQVVESTQGHLQCPQFVKGKTYGVAVNQVSSSADLQELKVTKSFYVEETMTCPS